MWNRLCDKLKADQVEAQKAVKVAEQPAAVEKPAEPRIPDFSKINRLASS